MHFDIDPKILDEIYRPMMTLDKRTSIIYGGAGSGKTVTFMRLAVIWALEGRTSLILRKWAAKLSDGNWPDTLKFMDEYDLTKYFDINNSTKTIKSKVSKGAIMFRGLDKESKIRSITSPTSGAIDTIIMDEATDFDKSDISQLILRQRGLTKFPLRLILLFNPIMKSHHIYKRYFQPIEAEYDFNQDDVRYYEDDDLMIMKTWYQDNSFIGEQAAKSYEDMKYDSLYHYNVFTLGRFGVLGERIFDDNLFDINHNNIPNHLEYKVGLDFGYNDPNAFILTAYDRRTNDIYVLADFVVSKQLHRELANKILDTFDRFNVPRNIAIFADSADPTAIATLNQFGLNVREPKSKAVLNGIMWLKLNSIYVSNKASSAKNDLTSYAWKKDKHTGEAIDEPDHTYSHLPDSLRYAYSYEWTGGMNTRGAHVRF